MNSLYYAAFGCFLFALIFTMNEQDVIKKANKENKEAPKYIYVFTFGKQITLMLTLLFLFMGITKSVF